MYIWKISISVKVYVHFVGLSWVSHRIWDFPGAICGLYDCNNRKQQCSKPVRRVSWRNLTLVIFYSKKTAINEPNLNISILGQSGLAAISNTVNSHSFQYCLLLVRALCLDLMILRLYFQSEYEILHGSLHSFWSTHLFCWTLVICRGYIIRDSQESSQRVSRNVANTPICH